MSTNDDSYLMPVEDKMKLNAYSIYIERQGLDAIDYHSKAIQYLEGEEETPPLAWGQAMAVLRGDLEDE